jgi:hypothetical protein
MKKIILAGVAALAFAGGVSAQQPGPGGGDVTRAAVVADAERRFAALDVDGNGELDAAEMRQMVEQRRAERLARMSPEDRARAGQRRGGRGGGEGAMRGGPRGPVTLAAFRARAEQRFDRLDLDRDGVITRAEQEQLRARRAAERSGD